MPSTPAALPPRAAPCSDLTRQRGDALLGTAPADRAWLLVEQPAGWERDVWAAAPVSAPARAEIDAVLQATGARFLTIRRPGRDIPPPTGTRRWAAVVADPAAPVRQQWGTWSEPDDLVEAAHALTALTQAPPTRLPAQQAALILVCTHAKRDQCCAVRGRPLAAALQQRWPERVWECSHVGGHRFAGNLLILPDGASYGLVDVDEAVDLVSGHLAGQVAGDRLRGFTGEPTLEQVATGAVYRDAGPHPARSLRVIDLKELGLGRWTAQVAAPDHRRWQVQVSREDLPPTPVSCGKAPEPVYQYRAEVDPTT